MHFRSRASLRRCPFCLTQIKQSAVAERKMSHLRAAQSHPISFSSTVILRHCAGQEGLRLAHAEELIDTYSGHHFTLDMALCYHSMVPACLCGNSLKMQSGCHAALDVRPQQIYIDDRIRFFQGVVNIEMFPIACIR